MDALHDTKAEPMNDLELRARFNAITAHYDSVRHCFAHSNEWDIDAYAWTAPGTGIDLTPIEFALWHDIRLENVVMYPQFPVGRFFVDFGNPVARVAIECDGARWHTDHQKDRERDAELAKRGWSVYRITGRDCFTDTEETEDEDGWATVVYGKARLFVRDICARHPVKRLARRTNGPRHIGEIVQERISHYEAMQEAAHG
jgi:very-short-patch-repair endonuclease